MSDDESEGGFMRFAQGWNQTVKGWYHEAAGTGEQVYGYLTDDEPTMLEGVVENAEGNAQADRGEALMGDGISDMLGLVDHGDPNAGAGGGPPYSSGGGAGGDTSVDGGTGGDTATDGGTDWSGAGGSTDETSNGGDATGSDDTSDGDGTGDSDSSTDDAPDEDDTLDGGS